MGITRIFFPVDGLPSLELKYKSLLEFTFIHWGTKSTGLLRNYGNTLYPGNLKQVWKQHQICCTVLNAARSVALNKIVSRFDPVFVDISWSFQCESVFICMWQFCILCGEPWFSRYPSEMNASYVAWVWKMYQSCNNTMILK